MLFHYNLLSIIVFIYWGVEYNSYNTITRDMTKYTHSHSSAALSRESCIYFSHIPRKHVITIKYIYMSHCMTPFSATMTNSPVACTFWGSDECLPSEPCLSFHLQSCWSSSFSMLGNCIEVLSFPSILKCSRCILTVDRW